MGQAGVPEQADSKVEDSGKKNESTPISFSGTPLGAARVQFVERPRGVLFLQALLFLEVMNWYDGLVIDKLWVGCSKFWVIPGMEDIPYVQTWRQMLKKRLLLSLIWVVGAALIAGIVVLLF